MSRTSAGSHGISTDFYFNSSYKKLKEIIDVSNVVFITDENVFKHHDLRFRTFKTIVIKPGEVNKVQSTVNIIIEQLIQFEADRKTILVGVGGGVVTDITGYVASIYMRGIQFGFMPTTLLSMVDASIGGKNGIDVGVYKNIVGTIRQPLFILHDYSFLHTLPLAEWQNGFAEMIKHACIKSMNMFSALEKYSLQYYQAHEEELSVLIELNARLKIKVVKMDQFEQGERKLLNFGHTIGHAIENMYGFSHGQAISIGMVYAANISEQLLGFTQTNELIEVLQKYGLPTEASFDKQKVIDIFKMDKKRERNTIHYILLNKIGRGVIRPILFEQLEQIIHSI